MTDSKPPVAEASKPTVPLKTVPKVEGNPVFLGLPRLRAKLPSRNWLIFLSVTGSFAGAVFYDRHHKKKAQQKWANMVAHLSRERCALNEMPRKITIYLSAPPGDNLRPSREYFKEYIKPILDAAALDWEVVEGRKEGDVRAGLAERIRKQRRRNGERVQGMTEEEQEEEDPIDMIRKRSGVYQSPDSGDDLVIGRNTWKEYIRGLHEGWLGPLEIPPEPVAEVPVTREAPVVAEAVASESSERLSSTSSDPEGQESNSSFLDDVQEPQGTVHTNASASKVGASTATIEAPAEPELEPAAEPPKPAKKISPTPATIMPSDYPTSPLAPTIPSTIGPTTPLPMRHILGFMNTPIRFYYFLTKRRLADDIGRQVAEMILAPTSEPWPVETEFASAIDPDTPTLPFSSAPSSSSSQTALSTVPSTDNVVQTTKPHSLASALAQEQSQWHKSALAPLPADSPNPNRERIWIDPVVVDERIASRIRKSVMTEQARQVAQERVREKEAEERRRREEEGKTGVLGVGKEWVERAGVWVGWREEGGGCKGWEQGRVGGEVD